MADNSESAMDYKAHEQTYESFIHVTVLIVAFCISIVVMLAVGNAGSWGLAGLGTFLAVIGAVVGFLMKGSPWPIALFTLGILALKVLVG